MNKSLATGLFTFFLLTPFAPLAYAEYIVPEAPSGHVLDEAGVLSLATEASLEADLTNLEAETSTQIVVVTLSDLQGYEPEEVGLAIGRTWGVGQEEFNNGLVFLIAPNDHLARIEVGYGLEGAITDLQSSQIIDECIPYFSEGDYDTGAQLGVLYLADLARGEPFTLDETSYPSDNVSNGEAFLTVLVYLIPLFWAILSWFSNTKSWWLGGVFGGAIGLFVTIALWGVIAGALGGLLLDFLLSKYLYQKIKPPRGWWFWGGGSGGGGVSGGSSGGGFGGFGGGSFGGGGATGRW